jgi:hypothetical protein
MTLVPLPALADNHIWMLQAGRRSITVRRAGAPTMLDMPDRAAQQLAAILVMPHDRGNAAGASGRLAPRNAFSRSPKLLHPILRSRDARAPRAAHAARSGPSGPSSAARTIAASRN